MFSSSSPKESPHLITPPSSSTTSSSPSKRRSALSIFLACISVILLLWLIAMVLLHSHPSLLSPLGSLRSFVNSDRLHAPSMITSFAAQAPAPTLLQESDPLPQRGGAGKHALPMLSSLPLLVASPLPALSPLTSPSSAAGSSPSKSSDPNANSNGGIIAPASPAVRIYRMFKKKYRAYRERKEREKQEKLEHAQSKYKKRNTYKNNTPAQASIHNREQSATSSSHILSASVISSSATSTSALDDPADLTPDDLMILAKLQDEQSRLDQEATASSLLDSPPIIGGAIVHESLEHDPELEFASYQHEPSRDRLPAASMRKAIPIARH